MSTVLQFHQAINRPDLISSSIISLLRDCQDPVLTHNILVAEINPAFAGGNDFCAQYSIPINEGANCVIVAAVRGETRTLAACVAPVNCRIDFNGTVKKILNARKVSLAPLEEVLEETQMEYGSITPIGLPSHWPVLIDARIVNVPRIIIGAGVAKAKLSLPGNLLAQITSAQIVDGLGI